MNAIRVRHTSCFLMLSALTAPAFLLGCASTGTPGAIPDGRWALDRTELNPSAARLDVNTAEHLAFAHALLQRTKEVTAPRTAANTLVPYNEMMMHIEAVASECSLFANVHPDAAVRAAAEAGEQAAGSFLTEITLDRDLYQAFAEMDVARENKATQFLVFKVLRDFRRAGIDLSRAEQARAKILNKEIVALGQDLLRNISADNREIVLDSVGNLAGLPKDFIANHQPGPDGKVHVNVTYPDYNPFMAYAQDADARLALYKEFKNRGYPKNMPVLDNLIARRSELATLLGYANWADYITEDKMIGSAANAQAFIDRIAEVVRPALEHDRKIMLAAKSVDVPGATDIGEWEQIYYEERVRAEQYGVDSQELREYFDFNDVRAGLFTLTERMFGIEYRAVEGLTLWHPSVTAWDVYDGGKQLGRFYLDLHPRPHKYSHAACFGFREGIEGKRLPQAVLVCNFPDPSKSADGRALMDHKKEVITFFHEFGHLLHAIFAGHRQWMGNSGINTEWDFVEAPSQMLEEWCWDAPTLQMFAKHVDTGEPIPTDLVARMNKAAHLGKPSWVAHQMLYASLSLGYYTADPATLDTTKKLVELQAKYSPHPYEPDTHFQCSFGHLNHYSAIYYTYMWSMVIGKDLFSRFEEDGLLNEATAREYRRCILDPGGSAPAAELVESFLGRPYSFDAYQEWLSQNVGG